MLTPLNLIISIGLVLFFIYLIVKPTNKGYVEEVVEFYVGSGGKDYNDWDEHDHTNLRDYSDDPVRNERRTAGNSYSHDRRRSRGAVSGESSAR